MYAVAGPDPALQQRLHSAVKTRVRLELRERLRLEGKTNVHERLLPAFDKRLHHVVATFGFSRLRLAFQISAFQTDAVVARLHQCWLPFDRPIPGS